MLIKNLSFLYRTTMASIPLLELAASKAEGNLKAYYEKHIEEERGHLEMLEDDLERMGIKEVGRYHSAALFSGSQYYLLNHDHPALFLGYMHLLESNAPKQELVDELEKQAGIPLYCLRHHCEHDPQHASDIEALIREQEPEVQHLIAWNEQHCAQLLYGIFLDMKNGNRTH